MRHCSLLTLALLAAACGSTPEPVEEAPSGPRPNVLLLCIDDLRPELGCYGAPLVRSPHLDALAAGGMRFDRHYVQFPTCGASRHSFLTGQRPSQPAHYGNGAFGSLGPDFDPASSLPGAFRAAGYHTVCLGKIGHSHDGRTASGESELPGAWDELPTDPGPWKAARHLLHGYVDGEPRTRGKSPISLFVGDSDEQYPDGILAQQAIEQLRLLSAGEDPFFLAVGFFKPHLPFAAPRPYWDLYGEYDSSTLAACVQPEMPDKLPQVHGWAQSGEVTRNYLAFGYEDNSWSTSDREHLRRSYLACTTYVDAQVGKVLDELERLGRAEDTIVVVWGDHGWHLGELGLFGKHTPYEASLRSTLIVRAPGTTAPGGQTRALVESLDVFPTLAELCGVASPAQLAGKSFAPVLRGETDAHRPAATSYWRRGKWLATSLRTERYRLVGWSDPITGNVGGIELYDLEPEPGAPGAVFESENIAISRAALVDELVRKYVNE